MDRNDEHFALNADAAYGSASASRSIFIAGFALAIALGVGGPSTSITPSADSLPCCENVAASGHANTVSLPAVAASSGDDRGTSADAVAEYVGGIAARIRTVDGSRVPGSLFLLMATAGSDATAQLYDATAYTHDYGDHADTLDSNITAAAIVETISGVDLDRLEFTTAPGGGPSGGLIYAIAYLNLVSDGAFTGDVRVAATGELGPLGYVGPIEGIDEKTAAAYLADADVLFTPSTPTSGHVDAYGARRVGELFRARNTGAALADERRLANYRDWGADRPNGMDIVGTRHIADVASYLCGAGSDYACEIADDFADDVISDARDDIATSRDLATQRSLR